MYRQNLERVCLRMVHITVQIDHITLCHAYLRAFELYSTTSVDPELVPIHNQSLICGGTWLITIVCRVG